jgi:hypothetical protein
MSEFSIRRVDPNLAQSVEPLGSKPKFWFREGEQRLLFKADDRGTGEDWAEVIACHLCELLEMPHVHYELAMEWEGEQESRPGVICENMARPPLTLVLGNELLLALDPKYPREKRVKVPQHTVEAVSEVVLRLAPPSMWKGDADIQSALDVFAGYIMLDAWIANPDRHHENWAALREGGEFRLAPTFDHGSGLARNLLDEDREERLNTKDQNRTVIAFARKGRSAFYLSAADKRPLGIRDAFLAFAQRVPKAANAWLGRLRGVNEEAVQGILDRVPARRMTGICKQFTLELLRVNRQRLLE